MPRPSTPSAHVQALRTIADELEAGTREKLSPAMAKALDHELARDDDRRLASYQAGRSQRRDVGPFLQELRAQR
jgi:hypothetical protein